MKEQWVQINIRPDLWTYKRVFVMKESDTKKRICLSASNKNGSVKACGENLKEAKKNIEPKIKDKLI